MPAKKNQNKRGNDDSQADTSKKQKTEEVYVEVLACKLIVDQEKHPFKSLDQDFVSVPISDILDRNSDLEKDEVVFCIFYQ